MTGAAKPSEPEPEPKPKADTRTVFLHTFNEDQSAGLEMFDDALRGLAELAFGECDMEPDLAAEVLMSRRNLGAIFTMLRFAHKNIVGPDMVGGIWIDPNWPRKAPN